MWAPPRLLRCNFQDRPGRGRILVSTRNRLRRIQLLVDLGLRASQLLVQLGAPASGSARQLQLLVGLGIPIHTPPRPAHVHV
jgi:hypothetical protein